MLTAGHVAPRDAHRVTVSFLDDDRPRAGSVIWSVHGAGREPDAALIRLDDHDLPERVRRAEPVRFGRFITRDGTVPAEAQGFPFAQRQADRREIEPLTGRIPCGAGAVTGRSHIVVDGAPPMMGSGAAWKGMSGAAVWSGDLLVGIVSADLTAWAGGRIAFQPIESLLAQAEFTAALGWGAMPTAAVELIQLAPLSASGTAGSPAQLLRAESQVIGFHGRDDELARLTQWCDGTGSSVLLLHAQGGQGKTRLALELLARRQALGWTCGVMRADFDTMSAALGRDDVERGLRRSVVPLLLMIDYAEAWRTASELSDDPVRKLLRLIRARPADAAPVRVLLVARSPGTWWTELGHQVDGLSFDEMKLGHLARAHALRPRLYREALRALAARLPELPGYHGPDWRQVAARIAPPEALGRTRYAHALTLYEQALADLLQSGPNPVPAADISSTEDILLAHESRYWRRTAEVHGLELVPAVLRETVAAMTLFGAGTVEQADNLVDTLPVLRGKDFGYRRRVTRWLAELYPDPGIVWGPLEPDRLGEYLVATVWGDNDALVALVQPHLLPGDGAVDEEVRLSDSQIRRMLIVLDRAAAGRDQLRGIQRTVFFFREIGRTLPLRPESERGEYLRLGAQKARVPAAYVDRIVAGLPPATGWRSRWAWWNAQRPAKVFGVRAQIHLAIVDIDGRPGILAVSAYDAAVYEPATGQRRQFWFGIEPAFATITAASTGIFGGRLHVAIGLSNGTVRVWRHDGDGAGVWLGPHVGAPTESTDLMHNVMCVLLTDIRGSLEVVSSERRDAISFWDPCTGSRLATLPAVFEGLTDGAEAMVAGELSGRPVLVTAHDTRHGLRVFDLHRLELTASYEFDVRVMDVIPTARAQSATDVPISVSRIIAGGAYGSVHIIDLDSGSMIGTMAGHSQAVTAVRVEDDGGVPIAVTTGTDRRVITWDLRTGDQLGSAYVGHTDRVRALTTGRLGRELVAVTAGADYTIRVWQLADVALPEAALTGHTEAITSIAVARDGGRHIGTTASQDRTVRVWDLDAGGRAGADGMPDLYRTSRTVTALAIAVHRDDIVLVTGDIDGGLGTLSPPAGRPGRGDVWLDHQIVGLDCRAFGDRILAVASDSTGKVLGWDPLTGTGLGPAIECGDTVHAVRLLTWQERVVALAATRKICTVIDLVTGTIENRAYGGEFRHDHIIGLGILKSRPCVLVAESGTGPDECVVRVLDLETRRPMRPELRFPTAIRIAELVDAGSECSLMAVGSDHQVWLRSFTEAGAETNPTGVVGYGHTIRGASVATTRYGADTAFLVGGDGGEVELVSTRTGVPLIDTEPVNSSAVTVADYEGVPVAVIASGTNKLVRRDLRTGQRIGAAIAAPLPIDMLQTLTAGGRAVVLGAGVAVRAWYAETMKPLPHWNDSEVVTSATLVVGDRVVVVTAHENRLTAADLEHRTPLGPGIPDLAADGVSKRVVLAAGVVRGRPIVFVAGRVGSTVRMWDLLTGRPVGATLYMAAITRLIVGSVDGTDVLYVIDAAGDIAEWPIDALRHRPLRRLLGAPEPRRGVIGDGEITAALVHPMLGLVVARSATVWLWPMTPDRSAPIHLDAPVTGLAAGDHCSLVVATEQGVAVLDLE